MRLDVSVARQVEDVDVGQEAVSGGVEGARPTRVKFGCWLVVFRDLMVQSISPT